MWAASTLPALFLLALFASNTEASLNVGTTSTDDMIRKLRQSVFVETALLEARPSNRICSSLDGPACFASMLHEPRVGYHDKSLDGPGILPELLLHDLGGNGPGEFATPGYTVLESFRQQLQAVAPLTSMPAALSGEDDNAELAAARTTAEMGILHFQGLDIDRKMPLSFSRGLPSDLVATWDGRWIVRDCSAASNNMLQQPLKALPAPPGILDMAKSYDSSLNGAVSTVAELTGSLGYLRFSKPVVVRSLYVRWTPSKQSPPALIGGRLGLEGVWASHLDPASLSEGQGWFDVAGGPLKTIDEIVFLATKGLELGVLEVVSTENGQSKFEEERKVLLLQPATAALSQTNRSYADESGEESPKFTLSVHKISPSSAPFVASLQEVIDRNLRIKTTLPSRQPGRSRGELVPGVIANNADTLEPTKDNIKFAITAATNEGFFEHKPLVAFQKLGIDHEMSKTLMSFTKKASKQLPEDLQRSWKEEGTEIAAAISDFIKVGGWHRNTPSSLPIDGSEEAVKRYYVAKKQQTKLDILTAVMMHSTPKPDGVKSKK